MATKKTRSSSTFLKTGETRVIKPQPGPQEAFLSTPADICLYGGAAGGGKTWALLLEALRHINNPDFGAVIFRRTSPQITNQGGLWDESWKLYPAMGGVGTENPFTWTFPPGSKVTIRSLQYDKDVYDWQGSQIPLELFDELTTFTKKQFMELMARNRSTCGVRPYVRATCNPDPDSWVLELVWWWIDEKGDPILERCGKLRWFVVVSDTFVWGDTPEELKAKYPDLIPLSFTFIHADLNDNQILKDADPGYLAKLQSLSHARRMALEKGNWKTRPEGKLFKYAWFKHCKPEEVPDLVEVVVGIDPSGGHGARNDEQGIVAAGKGRDGKYYVLEDATCKLSPTGWATVGIQTYATHKAGKIAAEANFGGEMVESNILAVDPNVKVKLVHASRGKIARAEPTANLAENGNLIFVGVMPELEAECVGYDPNEKVPSPNRMDAMVWAIIELMGGDDGQGLLEYYRRKEEEERKAAETITVNPLAQFPRNFRKN